MVQQTFEIFDNFMKQIKLALFWLYGHDYLHETGKISGVLSTFNLKQLRENYNQTPEVNVTTTVAPTDHPSYAYNILHQCFYSIKLFFSYKPILDYVNDQFNTYLKDESGLNRRNIVDNRIHCCFYFISPTGYVKLNWQNHDKAVIAILFYDCLFE